MPIYTAKPPTAPIANMEQLSCYHCLRTFQPTAAWLEMCCRCPNHQEGVDHGDETQPNDIDRGAGLDAPD